MHNCKSSENLHSHLSEAHMLSVIENTKEPVPKRARVITRTDRDRCVFVDDTYGEYRVRKGRDGATEFPCPCERSDCPPGILRWGPVNRAHLARKVEGVGGCGMTWEHATAQIAVQRVLAVGGCLTISTRCDGYGQMPCASIINEIRLRQGEQAKTEHQYEDSRRRADVAVVTPDGQTRVIIEVLHTSHTDESARPADMEWYEVHTQQILEQTELSLSLDCHRRRAQCTLCAREEERIRLCQEEERVRACHAENRAAEAWAAGVEPQTPAPAPKPVQPPKPLHAPRPAPDGRAEADLLSGCTPAGVDLVRTLARLRHDCPEFCRRHAVQPMMNMHEWEVSLREWYLMTEALCHGHALSLPEQRCMELMTPEQRRLRRTDCVRLRGRAN